MDAGLLHREGRLGDILRNDLARPRRRQSMRHVAHRIVVSIDTENTQHRANVDIQISVRWLNDRAELRGATRDFNPFYSHWPRRKNLALGDFGEWHEATR